jgi:hypothetical protein
MKVKTTKFTTLMQNDKKFNDQQRNFFKAAMKYDGSYLYYGKDDRRFYLFAFDQADLIHVGILGILYGLPKEKEEL